MRPDGAGYLPALDKLGLVATHIPNINGRNPYNFLLSYKGQRTEGSAKQKLDKEICDLGHWCDTDKIVAAVIMDMPLLSADEITHLKGLGRRHAVVVLTKAEVAAGLLPDALIAIAKRRQRLYRRLGPRGSYTPTKSFGRDRAEQGFVERIAARRDIGAKRVIAV